MSTTPLWDTHAHLTDPRFETDWEQAMEDALDAGVHGVINVAVDPATSREALAQAARLPGRMVATAGLHPHEAKRYGPGVREEIAEIATEPGVVAVGEIGLDYHYMHSERAAQRRAFFEQLEMAVNLERPIVVHSRGAESDVVGHLIEFRDRGCGGVLHCYTGGLAEAGRALDLGFHLSFTGIVTFAGGPLDDLVRYVPLERLLLETDSPYLAPVPHRGERNGPAFLPRIAEKIAGLKDVPVEQLVGAAARNAARLFGIPPDAD